MGLINRREFLQTLGLATITTHIPAALAKTPPQVIIKPPRLQVGDTIALVSPAGVVTEADIQQAQQTLTNLGLKVKQGKHILDRYGYLAGTDRNRAFDLNTMFADSTVKGIIAMRGGWGCNRLLPMLDYSIMRSHPKIILGYSDITSLLLAIHARSRIITFHAPVATSSANEFSLNYLKRVLFTGEAVTMLNPENAEAKVEVISPGKARGKLVGGNLSVLCAMLGSPYLPSWYHRILFVEDVGEDIYRIDRMLTQLKNAGILDQIAGFIFAQCTRCNPGDEPAFSLNQILKQHIQPLGIPAWYGSMIGHIQDKFTMALGVEVEVDANLGRIKMLESAVI
jgi:muramoyltetrapeptide carboxypeptidase